MTLWKLLIIVICYKEEISQLENNNLADFNNINDTILDTSEFDQRSHFVDNQTHIPGKIFNFYVQY